MLAVDTGRDGSRGGSEPYSVRMRSMTVQDTQVLVLANEDSQGGKGGLFERFVAKLLAHQYGFDDPTTRNVNVMAEGIELRRRR
jgi:hypothetical protein